MILKRILLSLGLVALLCTAAVAKTPSFSVDKFGASFSHGVTPEHIKGAKDKIAEMKLDNNKISYTLRWVKDADIVAFADAFPEAVKVKIHFAKELTNIAPLAKLVKVNDLWLDAKENLTDLSPLSKLVELTNLYVFYNASKQDLSWLAPLAKLRTLNLAGEGITSVETFPTLPSLTSLFLKVKEIPNVDPIVKGAPKLLYFGPSMGKIGSIESMGNMPSLKNFRPFLAEIKDFSGLAKAPKLEKLELVGVKNIDYTSLGGIKQLKTLSIDRAQTLTEISWVKGLTNIISFAILAGNVSDFTPIAALTNLQYLTLAGTKNPLDLNFAKTLTKLKTVRLNDAVGGVSNLAAISELPDLYAVYLAGKTPALDLAPLTKLPKLKTLSLSKKAYTDVKLPTFDKKVKVNLY